MDLIQIFLQALSLGKAMSGCDGDLFDLGLELVSEVDAGSDGEKAAPNIKAETAC